MTDFKTITLALKELRRLRMDGGADAATYSYAKGWNDALDNVVALAARHHPLPSPQRSDRE